MKDYSYTSFFSALSGERRMEIINFLHRHGRQSVSAIATGVGLEQSAVSHSLIKLLSYEFVHVESRGKERLYSLNSETIEPLLDLIDRHIVKFCQKQCSRCQPGCRGGRK